MLPWAPEFEKSDSAFQAAIACLRRTGSDWFGDPDVELKPVRTYVGPFTRVLKARAVGGGRQKDVFIKRFVPITDGPDEFARQHRYLASELERTRQAETAFERTPRLAVPKVLACWPELLTLVTEGADGVRLDSLFRRLAIRRTREAFGAVWCAMYEAGAWLRQFQTKVPICHPGVRRDHRAHVDVRLRALVAAGAGGFTEQGRGEILHLFDRYARDAVISETRPVAIHSDFCPANILVREDRLTVLDLAMSSDGSRYADLAHLNLHLKLLGRRWALRASTIDELEAALLAGFDPELGPSAPLFRQMLLGNVVNYLARCAQDVSKGWFADRRMRRRIEWGISVAAERGATPHRNRPIQSPDHPITRSPDFVI